MAAQMTEATGLEPGQRAPGFELRDQHGQSVTLSSYADRSPVLLVFYPFAFSGVCSGELHGLRDGWAEASAGRAELVALSCDPVHTLRAFAESDGLEFPLLSDFWPHGAVSSAYGAFDSGRGASTRSSFLVDRSGRLAWQVHHAIGDARDLRDYARALESLDQ